MRIQHNIPAMSSYRNYTNNTSALAKNLERLSSGYKINRAGDDAAGLAISEKMRAQITGLEVAQKNAKDGISLVQTAEGALTEVHSMLNRMYELAEQSANGTYDNEVDRAQLQKEIDSIKTEINRISQSANFNGIKLLDGSMSTVSTSALGTAAAATPSAAVDGSDPTAAGQAVATIQLNNAATAAAKTPKVKETHDGTDVAAATKTTASLTVGGLVKGDVVANGKIAGTPLSSDATTLNVSGWGANSEITVTVGSGNNAKSFTYTYDATTLNDKDALIDAMAKDGLTVTDSGTSSMTITSAVISGLYEKGAGTANTAKDITAGTTTIDSLAADYSLDGTATTNPALGANYDITVVSAANGKTYEVGSGYVIQNGDTINITAKHAGKPVTADVTAIKALADKTTGGVKGTNVETKAATVVEGTDEGTAAASTDKTTYEITFDIANLSGGQYIEIGGTKVTFKTDGTASAANTGADSIVNLREADANGDGSNEDEVAAKIKAALDAAIFTQTNKYHSGTAASTMTDNGDGTYTFKAVALANSDAPTSNLGEVRVYENNVDVTDTTSVITSTYTPAALTSGSSTPVTFADVTYTISADDIKAGTKITVGGKEVELVATASDVADANKQVALASIGTDLAKALEHQGFDSGKVTVTQNANGTDWDIKIIGTTVGETAADLMAGSGSISIITAGSYDASEVETANGDKITAGTTTIADLKNIKLADSVNLGDQFSIKVNGEEKDDAYVIQEGDKIEITSDIYGKLADDVLSAITFSGNANVTTKNGWDEGSSATGDNTHYDLTLDLSKAKLAGGVSFTFGNEDGTSITFDVSYDDVSTTNGTAGATDKVDVSDAGDKRVNINVFGMNEADIQDAILNAVKDNMGDFDVSAVKNTGTMTLNLDAKEAGMAYNYGNIRFSSAAGAITSSNYVPAGGGASGTEGTYAKLTYDFDASKLQDGDVLTVGQASVTLVKDGVTGVGKDGYVVNLADAQADPNGVLAKALEAAQSPNTNAGQITFADGKMTVTGIKTGEKAADLEANLGKVTVTSSTNRSFEGGGLTLQIGDTAEDFNQLKVSINACDSASIGIGDVDITTQDGAKDAMAAIKDAINYVSDVRGTLGATQNRLDHTINNLGVMQQNIQDAESTIRDVDIAKEMMAYTKNSILVQSAQAMLAQANQLPQGVLQLLQ